MGNYGEGGFVMPFGRGFGFRGWAPPWPYIGLGRGGLPRCWAYTPFWGAPYYPPEFPYGYSAGYPYGFGPGGFPYGSPMNSEAEKDWLKSQAESIKQQIDQINKRIVELERG